MNKQAEVRESGFCLPKISDGITESLCLPTWKASYFMRNGKLLCVLSCVSTADKREKKKYEKNLLIELEGGMEHNYN